MEQLVARRAHNPKVTGSSPVPATLKEDASASFFRLVRIPILGPQDFLQTLLNLIFSLNFFNHVHCLCIVQPSV
jgi:hypothetical protein